MRCINIDMLSRIRLHMLGEAHIFFYLFRVTCIHGSICGFLGKYCPYYLFHIDYNILFFLNHILRHIERNIEIGKSVFLWNPLLLCERIWCSSQVKRRSNSISNCFSKENRDANATMCIRGILTNKISTNTWYFQSAVMEKTNACNVQRQHTKWRRICWRSLLWSWRHSTSMGLFSLIRSPLIFLSVLYLFSY